MVLLHNHIANICHSDAKQAWICFPPLATTHHALISVLGADYEHLSDLLVIDFLLEPDCNHLRGQTTAQDNVQ